jgi:DNA-binding response OmpR family regulator
MRDNLDLLEYLLTDQGFEVVATDDPHEALKLVKVGLQSMYLDGRMRHISGFELCKKLRRLDAVTPILFFTPSAFEADKKLS